MCLDAITSYKLPPDEIRKAWKYGTDRSDHFETLIFSEYIPYSQWYEDLNMVPIRIHERRDSVGRLNYETYEPGFHCYKTNFMGILLDVVFVKQIVASGMRGTQEVYVAQKIYIPRPFAWIWQRDWWIKRFGIYFLPKEKV